MWYILNDMFRKGGLNVILGDVLIMWDESVMIIVFKVILYMVVKFGVWVGIKIEMIYWKNRLNLIW